MCPLHGPGHDMNSCKVVLAQAKAKKSTWSATHGGGTCCVRFQGAKKCPAKGEEINALLANPVKLVLTTNTRKKAMALIDSGSEDKQEHFNFETLNIGGE